MKIFGKQKHFLFFIIPHVQTLQVASRNSLCAARGRRKRIPENPENPVFDGFLPILVIFAIKNVADDLLIRAHLPLRSGFEASPTSNRPSSELKWSYEDFRCMLVNN